MTGNAAGTASERFVTWAAKTIERRVSRRGLLSRATLVGTAVSAVGWEYIVRPGSAYAWVCGEGASCYSGWTAMCCTINEGVNQCPPGSFAGGWWKAEDASLCGGRARYYVDCQAECSECGCHGSHFCEERCWSCRSHCADAGGCDRRRVCHTVFRYGQCNQHRECSGPVMCRTISCTPPWQWAECSTTAATSQATVSHSAPCLPGWSPIGERYTHLGSQGSILGASIGTEQQAVHGRMQRYVDGRMYYSSVTGAHYLRGQVLHCYVGLAESASPLRLPTTDSHQLLDVDGALVGYGATFERGAIYQRVGGSGYALWGAIFGRYVGAGDVAGELGFPTATLGVTADGQGEFVPFEQGAIYRDGVGPAYLLPAAVAQKYQSLGDVTSPLGYPAGEAVEVSDDQGVTGSQVSFAAGAVVVSGAGAYALWGPVFTAWSDQGGAAGELGFPVSDLSPGVEVDECDFTYGVITYDHTTGEVTTTLSPGA